MDIVRRCITVALILSLLAASTVTPVLAQMPGQVTEYRVVQGDRIFLSVPQRPDLNRELMVKEGGVVTLPLIGDVDVGGLTAREIEQRLLQALQDYYPSVKRIDVSVTQAVSQVIYVSGQVNSPGKYNFGTPPTVWEAIREAGGPLPEASLDNVRVVKDRSRGGTSTVVNVQEALERGSVDNLPELEGGDTVIVPAVAVMYTGAFGVNVFGAVVKPGVYRLQARQDLISAILVAGGPIERADLGKLKIIRPRPDGTIATVDIDLNRFLNDGDPLSNPELFPGDTINIPRQGRLSQLFNSDIGLWLSVVTTAVTVTALVVTLRDSK